MIYGILRYVIAILIGTAAYVGMDNLAPIIDPYLVTHFASFGDMSLTVARIAVVVFGTILGIIIGYFVSSFILKQGHATWQPSVVQILYWQSAIRKNSSAG